MVMRTYGLMGLGAAAWFWTLGLMDDHLISSIVTLALCLSFATLIVMKRNSTQVDLNQLEVNS